MKRRVIAALCACICMCAMYAMPIAADGSVDNSDLLPAYVPDSEVTYVNGTPDWAKDLILVQIRIETVTEEGTLESAVRVLDHYAEMGVNGIIVMPVSDRPMEGMQNGYQSRGPETIWSKVTGTDDPEEGWKRFKTFVDEAHKRNLRILLDFVTWGILSDAPVVQAHPEWFAGGGINDSGQPYTFCQWSQNGIRQYWADAIVDIVKTTGIDGIRCDGEPNTSGYAMYGAVRDRAYTELGRKLLIISETVNTRVDGQGRQVYDMEQWGGVTYHDRNQSGWGERLMRSRNTTFTQHYNIVDAIKTPGHTAVYADGRFPLYINMLSCQDNIETPAGGDRIYMGYQAIFAPFIPLWFMGEEWNNPQKFGGTGVMYFNEINWKAFEKAENQAFFEDIKRMIRVRRQYADVFTHFPDSVRDANICKVTTNRDDLQAYARWYGDTAVLIVPNTDDVRSSRKYTVTVPWDEMGLTGDTFVITDAYTGKVLAEGKPDSFSGSVNSIDVGAFVIKAKSAQITTVATTSTTSTASKATSGTTAPPPTSADGTTSSTADSTAATTDTAVTTVTTAPTATDSSVPADTAAPQGLHPGVIAGLCMGGVLLAGAVALLVLKKHKV